ncbi:MAG: phosphatase PAP2 family protein [Faecalibacterium sp.]|jgi:undecaprenyl-diphosphatase|nr:phosphatase PAP2 family protein [Faecalibacterium sp.]
MAWEFALLDAIQAHLRTAAGDFCMPLISALGNHGLLWVVLALALLIPKKTRRTGLVLSAALALDWGLCNGLLKPLVARTRPYDINTAIQLIAAKPHDYSFPSGHTAAAFTAVSALCQCKSRLFWPFFVCAGLIAFSRLYLYMHFPTDVLAGIVLGWGFGWMGAKLVAWGEAAYAARAKAKP